MNRLLRMIGLKIPPPLAVAALLLAFSSGCAAAMPPTLDAALARGAGDRMGGRPVAHENSLLRAIYARHPGPLWLAAGGLTPEGRRLIELLQSAARFGLDPRDYAAGSLAAAAALRSGAALELKLTRAAIRLVTDLHYGRVDPRAAGFELPPRPRNLDVAAAVTALAAAPHVRAALAAIEPPFYHYRLLERALARYRLLAAEPGLTRLPPLPRRSLEAGDAYAGVPALRRRLAAVGDLPAGAMTPPSVVLDAALVEALKRFELRHGLAADGVLGPQTFAALTTPMSHRVEQIDLTLERWRWLPPFSAPPIIVNIPQFRLFAFPTTADRVAGMLQMAVIVGQTYPLMRTPVFTGQIRYVVFRPYWNVPRSILDKELLPRIRQNPDYLAKNHLELVRGESDSSPVVAPSSAAIAALAAGRLRLRQRPGEDNALGLVNFFLCYGDDVYLHGTPAHRLFSETRRAFSHGCIRVRDPVALARYVLRNGPGRWDSVRILAAMHGRNAVRVELPQPQPVMILYGTALATEAGPVDFFADLYGEDRRLAALLRRHGAS